LESELKSNLCRFESTFRKPYKFFTTGDWQQLFALLNTQNLESRSQVTKETSVMYVPAKINVAEIALAACLSGHRISLRDSRLGFESRQGTRFLGKHSNGVVCF
jgi:hypothetical protein